MVGCMQCRYLKWYNTPLNVTDKMKKIVGLIGNPCPRHIPYCKLHQEYFHKIPDVTQGKTWIEDVWVVGCDKAHAMEHTKYKMGKVFPVLTKGKKYDDFEARPTTRSYRRGRKVI